jgi:hypothetical protein
MKPAGAGRGRYHHHQLWMMESGMSSENGELAKGVSQLQECLLKKRYVG